MASIHTTCGSVQLNRAQSASQRSTLTKKALLLIAIVFRSCCGPQTYDEALYFGQSAIAMWISPQTGHDLSSLFSRRVSSSNLNSLMFSDEYWNRSGSE